MERYRISWYKIENLKGTCITIFYIQQRMFLFFWKPYKTLTKNGWYYPQFIIEEEAKEYINNLKKVK